MEARKKDVLTVGHSTHPLAVFLDLLRQHGVTALADVRSSPYSRMNPQYNRESLAAALKDEGIKYVFLGKELGARSDDPACYQNGRVQYQRLAQTSLFKSGIERVLQGAASHRIALMCAEKEPLECHRTLLVSRSLAEQGVEVSHILADGRIEPHAATLERLFDITGVPHEDMFQSREELLSKAMARQEVRIAYVDEAAAADGKPA